MGLLDHRVGGLALKTIAFDYGRGICTPDSSPHPKMQGGRHFADLRV